MKVRYPIIRTTNPLLLTAVVQLHWRDHWPTYIDVWPGTPCSLAWPVAGCNMLGDWWKLQRASSRPEVRTAAKSVIKGKHQLMPSPADFQFLAGRCRIAYVYVWLESSYHPPEGHPEHHAYTFVIRILSTSLTLVSSFSVCCCSRYVSLWMRHSDV